MRFGWVAAAAACVVTVPAAASDFVYLDHVTATFTSIVTSYSINCPEEPCPTEVLVPVGSELVSTFTVSNLNRFNPYAANGEFNIFAEGGYPDYVSVSIKLNGEVLRLGIGGYVDNATLYLEGGRVVGLSALKTDEVLYAAFSSVSNHLSVRQEFSGYPDYINASYEADIDPSSLSIVTTYVPEPATWAMMISGVGMLGGAARRRRPRVSFA